MSDKKITHTNYRNHSGCGEKMLGDPYPQSVMKALESLVVFEYGYGGYPTVVTPTRVEVVTTVMSCLDRTVFEGTEVDMAPLVLASYFVAEARGDQKTLDTIREHLVAVTDTPAFHGNAFLITTAFPILMGQDVVRQALLRMVDPQPREESQRLALRLPTNDFTAAALLAYEQGLGFVETCTQLGLTEVTA